MTVYSVGTPVNTHSTTGSVTGTWGAAQFRVAGHLLVAVVTCAASTSVTATATASGWTNQLEVPNTATAQVRAAIWTKVAAGSDAAPTFTSTEAGTAGGMDCMLFELSEANITTPIDVSATYASGAVAGTVTGTATTGSNVTANGELGLAVFAQEAAAASLTFNDTGTGGFSRLLNGNGAVSVLQTYVGIIGPPGAATLNDAGAFSVNTTAFGAGLVVVFAPAVRVTPAFNFSFANNAAATVTTGGTSAPSSGAIETWTVNVTAAFPVASSAAGPPTQFSVIDPALPNEKFMVTAAPGGTGVSQSWTVVRGAEATTPVSHAGGFTITPVVTGGWLSGVTAAQSATAYVNCDYTGAVDASAAFNTALASLPTSAGRAVGTIIFGPGNVKMAVTPDNPGPNVYIKGAGKWATSIMSYVVGGDCFRIFDSSVAAAVDATTNGGGIYDMTINGTNAGTSSTGLHIGDVTDYALDVVVINFSGTTAKGVWFDNELYWTEQLRGELYVSGCTQCVVFDNPASAASTSSSSFSRANLVIKIEQGLNGSGQVYGDGVVLQNGAVLIDSDVSILGNYAKSLAATSAAVIRITGTTPAGHAFTNTAGFVSSHIHVGVELNTRGANAFSPMSIFSDGVGHIVNCYGVLDFGASGTLFAPSNIANQLANCNFVYNGDNNLGAAFQVFDTEQFSALGAAYTLSNVTTAVPLFNSSALGTLSVPLLGGNVYFFEAEFDITGLSGSAHTISFGFGGTATYTSLKYVANVNTGAAGTLATWSTIVVTSSAATVITASVTTTTMQARISGIIRVNVGGTIIPQITQGTASAAAVVSTNSWIRFNLVGNSINTAGTWS